GVEETIYFVREPQRAKFEEALDKVLTKRLEVDGPHSAQEVAVALGLEPELVEEVLRDLESEGIVSSGHFLVDKEFQYMLTRDLQRLQRKGETREVFDENQVKALLLDKQFASLGTLDEYFDRFLEAGMVLDVYNHAPRFDYREWLRRREAGDILEGRFLNGRVRYVRSKDVPLFLAAFPRSPLTEFEAKVLDVIRAGDGVGGEGVGTRIRVTGEAESEMYVLKDDLPALRKAAGRSASDPFRVLSLLDPWTQPLWAQVASRYGEGWFFPLVKDGDLVGMA